MEDDTCSQQTTNASSSLSSFKCSKREPPRICGKMCGNIVAVVTKRGLMLPFQVSRQLCRIRFHHLLLGVINKTFSSNLVWGVFIYRWGKTGNCACFHDTILKYFFVQPQEV